MTHTPTQFESGQIIYATLTCAHSDFPVEITRRTAKSIWIKPCHHNGYSEKRCAVRVYNGREYANAWGSWHLSSASTKPNGFDMQTI